VFLVQSAADVQRAQEGEDESLQEADGHLDHQNEQKEGERERSDQREGDAVRGAAQNAVNAPEIMGEYVMSPVMTRIMM
jgi:hypothetical protein